MDPLGDGDCCSCYCAVGCHCICSTFEREGALFEALVSIRMIIDPSFFRGNIEGG